MSSVTEQLTAFQQIAVSPQKQFQKLLSEARKMVGCLPEYTPEELVVTAGMVPFGIWGAETEISEAKRFFPPFYCSIAQTSLEMGLRGELAELSAVLIPMLCDTLKCLGQNWKIGVRKVPFIQVSYPQNVLDPAATVYLTKVFRRIATDLERFSGIKVTDAGLEEAIAIYNAHRAVMREFATAVGEYPHLVTPYQRNCVFKSAYFMPKADHAKMVHDLIDLLKAQPKAPWKGRKVALAGILADSPALLRILEESKIAVVADEVAHESRRYRTDVPNGGGDPFQALAAQFTSIRGCSLVFDPAKSRAPMMVKLAKESGAQGVIYLQTKFCDPEEFDYPIVKRCLEKAGIPCLNIEVDQQMRNYEQARTAIETFSQMLA